MSDHWRHKLMAAEVEMQSREDFRKLEKKHKENERIRANGEMLGILLDMLGIPADLRLDDGYAEIEDYTLYLSEFELVIHPQKSEVIVTAHRIYCTLNISRGKRVVRVDLSYSATEPDLIDIVPVRARVSHSLRILDESIEISNVLTQKQVTDTDNMVQP